MTRPHRLYVGTIGEGLFRSLDSGDSFRRACEGMFVECDVRALVVHPRDDATLYLGSELGVFISRDGADSWTKLPAPLDGLEVWSLWVVPQHPETILAGTRPSRIFRSDDGGATWSEATAPIERNCPRILHTRVTTIAGDPANAAHLWAGVEIDGVYESHDTGRTWKPLGHGLSSRDIHGLAVIGPGRLLATTNNDVNLSSDGGATWTPLDLKRLLPWSYYRGLAQKVNQRECVFLGHGDFPPGAGGQIVRSADGGTTWRMTPLPLPQANSTIWNFAVHPADPELIYASSVSGQVFRSTDGGATWLKLAREFGEIRALAWTP
jgi:photosystem II stability/assembly factor-like uncharacterized protein